MGDHGEVLRRLTIERTTVVIVFAFVVLVGIRPSVDADLWWHLALGRWMVDNHQVIGGDPFTWTRAGVTRVPADWLGQVVFWGTWSLGGLTAVVLLIAALATAGMAAVYRACTGAVLVRVGLVVVATMASSIFWSARPQMFTFAFTAVTVLVLRRWRADPQRRTVWLLVPLFVLWSNLHGGVVYGLVIVVATFVGEIADRVVRRDRDAEPVPRPAARTLAAVTALCFAAPMASAAGVAIYTLPFEHYRRNAVVIEEFQPPSIADSNTWAYFALLLVTVALVVRNRRHVRAADVLVVIAAAGLSLRFTRAVSFFAVVAAPIISDQVAAWREERVRSSDARSMASSPLPARPTVLAAAIAVTVVLLGVGVVNRAAKAHDDVAVSFPVDAQAWMAQNRPPDRLFNPFSWGGYLELEDPARLVAIDSRNDLYDGELDWYAGIATASGDWQGELERAGVNTVLTPTGSVLDQALRATPGWQKAHTDPVATIFIRE